MRKILHSPASNGLYQSYGRMIIISMTRMKVRMGFIANTARSHI